MSTTGGQNLGGMGGSDPVGPGRTYPIWGDPKIALTPVEGEKDQDPCMSPDGLELYFLSTRSGGPGKNDIWRATRASTADEWGAPAPVPTVSSGENEATPYVLADGLNMVFARSDGSDFSLFGTSRTSLADPWGTPAILGGLGGNARGLAPDITADGLTLFFARSGEALDVDIFRATRATTSDDFGPAELAAGLNTDGDDWDATSQDDLTVIFNRNADLWVSERSSTSEPFGPAQALTELNTDLAETDPWLSLDGRAHAKRPARVCSRVCKATRLRLRRSLRRRAPQW
jgi:hypothetical protein